MRRRSILRSPPGVAALAVLLVTVPLAWSRDMGIVLLIFFVYPMMLLISFGLLLGAVLSARGWRRLSLLVASFLLIALPPATLFAEARLHDRIAFLLWYPAHRDLVDKAAEGIITYWGAYGFVGSTTYSFLVAAPDAQMATPDGTLDWIKRHVPDCQALAPSDRMWRGIYVVTCDT